MRSMCTSKQIRQVLGPDGVDPALYRQAARARGKAHDRRWGYKFVTPFLPLGLHAAYFHPASGFRTCSTRSSSYK
jgi:hypothetical protein